MRIIIAGSFYFIIAKFKLKWWIICALHQVKFPQGTEMLNIFKNYSAKTSIFDDFEFYENRQKLLHDKRIMQFVPRLEHYQVSICK